jgi:bcr-type benzoyl-CoA reductase subunit C
MSILDRMFTFFADICENPGEQLKKTLASGRKAVGVMPYFCPEELVYAAGMLPFGLWGCETQVSESKRYFPAFICSILHTTLEMGIKGRLSGLSAVMVPICCDSLKCMGANWEYGVPDIPVINVAYAENRKIPAGVEFTVSQFQKIRRQLAELTGRDISDRDIAEAIAVYNENRVSLLAFTAAASRHPETVSPAARCAVIKAGYFMDRREHTGYVRKLTAELDALPEKPWDGCRVVTTGIIADSPALLKILAENKIAVADDQIASESVSIRSCTPVTEDPVVGMAQRLGRLEGCSVLFDPGKNRGKELVELAKASGADGIIWVMTKFCDPEEYDYVPVKRMIDRAGIPLLTLETDQQMTDYGQARSAVEAFRERFQNAV